MREIDGTDFTTVDDVRLADRITALVLEKDVDPKHMVLEVTESAAAIHLGSVLEKLSRLRIRGFGH